MSGNVTKCQEMLQNVRKCYKMSTKCQEILQNVRKYYKISRNVPQNFAKFCNFFFAKSENISKFFEILQFFLKTVET